MAPDADALSQHLEQLTAHVQELRKLAKRQASGRPPRWPWLLVALLTGAGLMAVWQSFRDGREPHTIIAPIQPIGSDARRLWLP